MTAQQTFLRTILAACLVFALCIDNTTKAQSDIASTGAQYVPASALTASRMNVKSFLEMPELEWLPCLLYTSPSPRDQRGSRMPSSA